MKLDELFLAGAAAYLPGRMSIEEAMTAGMHTAKKRGKEGWTGAAVAGAISAPDLAVVAAQEAMRRSAHAPSDIALLIHANLFHQGPDVWAAQAYIQRNTVGGHCPALEVRQGCCGMLMALELAACFLGASSGRSAALVTGADNFGAPLIDRWNYAGAIGRGSVFGDAGTAAVVSRKCGFARLLAVNSASLPEYEELCRGTRPLFPPDCTVGRTVDLAERVQSRVTDNLGAYLRDAAEGIARARNALVAKTLDEAGVRPADIARATHVFSGDGAYVKNVLEPVGIDASRGLLEFGRANGHLGVSDHIAGLDHLVETHAITKGDRVLMIANGIGVSLAVLVLEMMA